MCGKPLPQMEKKMSNEQAVMLARLPGQAQKELFHNEALARIDIALEAAVEGPPQAVPPAAPQPGQCWIVAPVGATGEWSGKSNMLAGWTDGGWRVVAPQPGMQVWVKTLGVWFHWKGSAWSAGELPATRVSINGQQVVGERQPRGSQVLLAER